MALDNGRVATNAVVWSFVVRPLTARGSDIGAVLVVGRVDWGDMSHSTHDIPPSQHNASVSCGFMSTRLYTGRMCARSLWVLLEGKLLSQVVEEQGGGSGVLFILSPHYTCVMLRGNWIETTFKRNLSRRHLPLGFVVSWDFAQGHQSLSRMSCIQPMPFCLVLLWYNINFSQFLCTTSLILYILICMLVIATVKLYNKCCWLQ